MGFGVGPSLDAPDRRVPPLVAALRSACPRCGEGPLFQGFLAVRPRCSVCDLDLSPADSGDGPAFFVMWIVGAVVVVMMGLTEVLFQPPIWVHVVLWGPAILGGTLALLRPCKALLIALQYRHRIVFTDDPTQPDGR